jgi:hypothetical protein
MIMTMIALKRQFIKGFHVYLVITTIVQNRITGIDAQEKNCTLNRKVCIKPPSESFKRVIFRSSLLLITAVANYKFTINNSSTLLWLK